MAKELITWGDTVESAVESACVELGVPQSKVAYEVLEEPVKKTFGIFGGSKAKVKVSVILNAKEKALNYIEDVFKAMGINDLVIKTEEENEALQLTLEAQQDISFVIGYRGDTLDSLQYLTSLVANQGEDKYKRISIDVGTFRKKRLETLEMLGKKMANKALKYGRNQILEPMNPYERRIIHSAASTVEGVKSWSEGEDLARHIVIGPVDGERKYRGNNYNNNRNNNSRNYNNNSRGQRNNYSKENNEFRKKVNEAVIYENTDNEYVSAPLDENIVIKKQEDAPLYGRIK